MHYECILASVLVRVVVRILTMFWFVHAAGISMCNSTYINKYISKCISSTYINHVDVHATGVIGN